MDKQLVYFAKWDEDYSNNKKDMIKVFGTWSKMIVHSFITGLLVL